MNKSKFSPELIKEYQEELYINYGVFVSDEKAQMQLLSLVRSMFGTVIAEQITESREQGARVGVSRPCAGSLSVMLGSDGE